MKKSSGLALVSLLMLSSAAFAVDGTISFNGELVSGTCVPKLEGDAVNGSGNSTATVVLPTLNVAALSKAQATGGLTGFTISLKGSNDTDCAVDGKIATPYFEPEVAKVNSEGRVINTEAATKDAIDIQILNNAQTVINLTDNPATQLSSTATGDADNHEYNYKYYAQYFAKSNEAKAGKVAGTLSYSIIYK
ncbi:fimbrial protein [Acinetobacter larvae]|uniref:Fimbrial protein n=1 Tax=Acinetobacter larvae TaxID=1789224 RepID=A0A1B2LWK9_9GAMM|nr:fimbrial protein [Acinetobacter larvae]AOA57327.1 hypothetical protein BFG52_02450 [Acinetobacter larvae]